MMLSMNVVLGLARIAIMLVVGACTVGCEHGQFKRYAFARVRMGTQAKIVIYSDQPVAYVEAAAERAFARIAKIEVWTSDWLVDGPVAELRSTPAGRQVSLPEDLVAVLKVSEPMVALTNGAFDPSCGRLTLLWREASVRGTPPAQGAVETALAGSGWDRLHFNLASSSMKPEAPVPWLDFGGIGKGFAADEALAVLDTHGLGYSMVEIGGDLALGDVPPDARNWIIQAPGRARWLVQGRRGVATSGPGEQHLIVGDRQLSHVLDPRTGAPVEDTSAFIITAPTGAQADALASAACVLGVSELQRLLEQRWPDRAWSIDRH
jgi:thiamine biosynthesis lipoprotein